MRNTRLNINIEELWQNNESENNAFSIRFRDLNPQQQRSFSLKIKETARSIRLKRKTTDEIQSGLLQINPIIYETGNTINLNNQSWYRRRPYQTFNFNQVRSLYGYFYHKLCKALYLIICLNRELTENEIYHICTTTCSDYQKIQNFLNRTIINRTNQQSEQLTPIEEIGLDNVNNAWRNTERRNNERMQQSRREEELNNIDRVRIQAGQPTLRERGLRPDYIIRDEIDSLTQAIIRPPSPTGDMGTNNY